MKRIFILVCFIGFTCFVKAQLTQIDTTYGRVKEIYYVDNLGLKSGPYKFKYGGKTQVEGFYKNGMKVGKWVFKPDKNYVLNGFYKNNTKDSIWTCFLNEMLYGKIDYRTGSTVSYYPNGKISSKGDSLRNGKFRFTSFYYNGNVRRTEELDGVFVVHKAYDSIGNLTKHLVLKNELPYNIYATSEGEYSYFRGEVSDGTGEVKIYRLLPKTKEYYLRERFDIVNSEINGKYESYIREGKKYVEGAYENGYMVGTWKKFNNNRSISENASFHEKVPVFQKKYTLNDSLQKDTDVKMGYKKSTPFIIEGDMPKFMGKDINMFRTFIAKNLRYPELAAKHGIQGKVYVQFAISSTGKVTDVTIVRSVVEILDREALRVVQSSPYWRPGFQGKPVKVQFTFPIAFVLQ